MKARGSPPRMRGKPRRIGWQSATHRITPADAGKTYKKNSPYKGCQDHPRGCGENKHCRVQATQGRGSPPRMRGKPNDAGRAEKRSRITPADAGKTVPSAAFPQSAQDHPRGCGENPHERLQEEVDYGSPPRMRGKPRAKMLEIAFERITPADAGKTHSTTQVEMLTEDHPRGCGENASLAKTLHTETGSPPRMRGKHPRRSRTGL